MEALRYEITDTETGEVRRIDPISYEDPMHPGTAKAMPVSVEKEENRVILDNGYQKEVLPKEDLEAGRLILRTSPYRPVLPKEKPRSCVPCTGCGRCSW